MLVCSTYYHNRLIVTKTKLFTRLFIYPPKFIIFPPFLFTRTIIIIRLDG